jgi:hypothetical protein
VGDKFGGALVHFAGWCTCSGPRVTEYGGKVEEFRSKDVRSSAIPGVLQVCLAFTCVGTLFFAQGHFPCMRVEIIAAVVQMNPIEMRLLSTDPKGCSVCSTFATIPPLNKRGNVIYNTRPQRPIQGSSANRDAGEHLIFLF